LFRVSGERGRSEHGSKAWLHTSTARALIALALLGAVQATAQPAAKYTNLSSEQAQTLLALAHDYHPRDGVAESHYTSCIAPYDVQAGNAQDRRRMDAALVLVEGAVRRMGYPSYAAITDDYERMRVAKMLAEKQWMKQFRIEVGQCLDRAAQPR
jgi:hypothetical protein